MRKLTDLSRRRTFMKSLATAGVATALMPDGAIAAMGSKPETIPFSGRTIASDAATVVEITSGKLRGVNHGGIFSFKGIPYGDSAAGENRFMPPQPVKPWRGIRNALSYGRACIQPDSDSAHFDYDGRNQPGSERDFLLQADGQLRPGEDCLQLNVWTAGIADQGRRPVMVYLHGGGFSTGFDHALAGYDGEQLARRGVVVVTCNHRLNLFGFLNLTELGSTRHTANAGLLDMAASLEWVKQNIAQFGGDPGNVTIFGQSGGGGKVACLMAMPAARGLFHRALIQSGPFLDFETRETSRAMAEEMMRQLGLARGDYEKLAAMPVDRLVGAASEMMKKYGAAAPIFRRQYGLAGWWPLVDGTVLPHNPFEPEALAISAHVPLVTGTVFNEFSAAVDLPGGHLMSEAELRAGVREAFGGAGDAIIAAYRTSWPRATVQEIYSAIAAEPFRRCAFKQARRKAALNQAASYVYVYNWRTPMLDGRPGTFHACDIAFTFDNAERCCNYSGLKPEAMALSRNIAGAWVAFARTGNPNHAGLPHWPAYRDEKSGTMVFGDPCEVHEGLEAEGLKLISAA